MAATALGGAFLMNAGGKDANQAVAAARLGALTSAYDRNEINESLKL